jgi:tetratricopeptide (TPR) repeat protein
MERWATALCLIAWLFSVPLRGQSRNPGCDGTAPTHVIGRDGNVLPEYREWDPGPCPPDVPRPTSTGTISARALAHKPLKNARREYDRGVQAWRKGQSDEAIRYLLEAVGLDPKFVDAQSEVGFLYVKTGRPALALDYLDRALALEPNLAVLHTNMASALVTLNRPEEAERESRRAVQLDPASIEANYMLGIAMLMQNKITPEAAAHLAVASDKYSRARAFLVEVEADLTGKEPPR